MERTLFPSPWIAIAELVLAWAGVIAVGSALGVLLLGLQAPDDLAASLAARLPWLLTLQAVVFGVPGIVLARRRLAHDGQRPLSPALRVALYGVGGGLAAFGASILVSLILRALGVVVEEQEWARQVLSEPRSILVVAPWVVLIVPLSEELFFRGYVFRFATERAGLLAGLGVSSLLFGISHFNLPGLPVYFVIGLVLAAAYRRTSSLAAPVLAHVTHNALVLLTNLIAIRELS
ncbi:MAG: CPBP family intramembrane metalloprotease [bacterium]|nr:CPBP family intramembrane metalloprotease [bacterium]